MSADDPHEFNAAEPSDEPAGQLPGHQSPDGRSGQHGVELNPSAAEQKPLPDKKHRTRFRRKTDYVLAVFITVAVVAVSVVLASRSDAENTVSQTASAQPQVLVSPMSVPKTMRQVWQAPSAATAVPVTVNPSVITGNDGEVLGRDPSTGTPRWRYARDLTLCTVASAWSQVLAVYRKSTGCSEVTALEASSGARGAQRNGDAQLNTRLVTDGSYVTTTGPTLSDSWRSDLVQTMEYGDVPDFNNPGLQPRPDCAHGTVAASDGNVAIIERCAQEDGDRLTVYKADNDEDSTKPKVTFSTEIGSRGARVIAANDSYVAVVVPQPTRLVVFDAHNGNTKASYPLRLPASDLAGDPPGLVVPIGTTNRSVCWYTGSSTIALDPHTFRPQWTVDGARGPCVAFAGKVLLPVPNGLAVLDDGTGHAERTIAVDRHGYTGTVELGTLGQLVFEQRGSTLFALR